MSDPKATLVTVHCPLCGGRSVDAEASTTVYRGYVLGIPLGSAKETRVRCRACSGVFQSRIDSARLLELSPEDSEGELFHDAPVHHQVLAILSVFAAAVPAIGVVVAALAAWVTRNTPRWTGTLSRWILTLATVWTVVFFVWLAYRKLVETPAG